MHSITIRRLFFSSADCSFVITTLLSFIPLSPFRIRFFVYTMERMAPAVHHTVVKNVTAMIVEMRTHQQRLGLYMMNHNGLYSLTSFSVLFIKSNAHQLISSSYHLLLILEIMTSFGPFNNVSYSSIHSVTSPINERFDFY